jgi:ring-1,2-phenylacetyl-CoA epoxidase subunit PaaB
MALLNARDVHVRRPACASLWVARADQIFSMTAEELNAHPESLSTSQHPNLQPETYLVFQKTSQRRAMTFVTHIGEVEARSPQEALQLALEKYPAQAVFVWWACPASAITRSESGIEDSWFAPARAKTYKQQSEYGDVGGLRQKMRRSQ